MRWFLLYFDVQNDLQSHEQVSPKSCQTQLRYVLSRFCRGVRNPDLRYSETPDQLAVAELRLNPL